MYNIESSLDVFLLTSKTTKLLTSPFGIEKIQRTLLFRGETSGCIVTLAPGGHHEVSTWLKNARHLTDVLPFIGHMLAAFTTPDDILNAKSHEKTCSAWIRTKLSLSYAMSSASITSNRALGMFRS